MVLYYSFLVQVNDLNIASIIDLSINIHINKKILINITNTGNGMVMIGPWQEHPQGLAVIHKLPLSSSQVYQDRQGRLTWVKPYIQPVIYTLSYIHA